MIPKAYIDDWRSQAPWKTDVQVEQDLVLCRALVEIFSEEYLRERLAFRGGTALHKLHLHPGKRYSEDIDLVQVNAEPIGETLDRLREKIDPWLGVPKRKLNEGRVTLSYRFLSEDSGIPSRLKIEINSREHFNVMGLKSKPFRVKNPWFEAEAEVVSYDIHELLGTKMRALYQRRKGRDLFDLAESLCDLTLDPTKLLNCFESYLGNDGIKVSRAQFEENLDTKKSHPSFVTDILPLISNSMEWDVEDACERVMTELVSRLSGEPWRRT